MQFALVLLLMVLMAGSCFAAEVRVWQGTMSLPTYEEGPPDVNPPFEAFSARFVNYPYANRDNLTDRKVTRNWRALYLENEYLKCSVLPDLGGHLYSCTDKLNGAEMFYANPSIKKARISYRGAWAAFGIEFNFPVSHNWVSLSPVDFAWTKYPDGSASVTVANIDRPYGMQWRVELVLRPGSTVLEQRVALYNPSDEAHRYYYWNNAGVQVWDDTRIHYPMRWSASHGFTYVDRWPVNRSGHDLSVVGNHTLGNVSQFAHGSREPFMGVYHPHNSAGVVHYADFAELPGKKLWSWGVTTDGREWSKALSDNDSQYVEVQAGPFRNQETYAFLEPQQTMRFTEYWMPVRAIGGITRANLHGVVYLKREAAEGGKVKLTAGLNVNHAIDGARVRIRDGARNVMEAVEKLDPSKPYTRTVDSLEAARKYTFELADASGKLLLAHTEDKFDWSPESDIKVGPQPPVEREQDPLEKGQDLELNGRPMQAWEAYMAGLRSSPANFELNRAAGRLAVTLKRYQEAVTLLLTAQYRSSNDPEIHYYLGNAYAALGDSRKARTEWEGAQRQPPLRPAARFALARLSAREGNTAEALDWIARAIEESPYMVRAGGVQVALLRRAGRKEEASLALKRWLSLDPTGNLLRNEAVLLGKPDETLWRHLGAEPERVLGIASDYIEIGAYDDAVALLERRYPQAGEQETEAGAVPPQSHPEVAYYRGYCREKQGNSGLADFIAASRMSTRYIFPNRASSLPVLKLAAAKNPNDATAHFLLGSLYMSGGLADDAIREWEAARKIDPRIPVLHRNLGRALLSVKREDERALTVLREGLTADPENAEVYSNATRALAILRRPASERADVLLRYPNRAAMPQGLVQDLALSLAEAGRYQDAEKEFHNRFFVREENGTDVRQVWLEVRLLQATQLVREGKTEAAQAVFRDLGRKVPGLSFTETRMAAFMRGTRFEYIAGRVASLAGDKESAAAMWKQAAASTGPWAAMAAKRIGEAEWRVRVERELVRTQNPLDRALLLRELGREEEAVEAFRSILRAPDRDLAHFYARRELLEKPEAGK